MARSTLRPSSEEFLAHFPPDIQALAELLLTAAEVTWMPKALRVRPT